MDTNVEYQQPPQPAVPPSPPPKKKRKGCLVAAIIAAVLLFGCIGTVVVVTLVASNHESVTYSEADFDSVIGKIGVAWPELPEGADPADYERVYTGERPVDVTLTSAEISALMSYRHDASYWPISNMAVELTGGNSATATMDVAFMGRSWPVEASGSATAEGGGLGISLASAKVMGISVPGQYLPYGADFLENVINPRLSRAGIRVDAIETSGDGIRFVGTTWESAEYVHK
jgi:hypothetical protein